MELRVALGQMGIVPGEPVLNAEALGEVAARAAGGGASLLVVPELWLTGYDLSVAVERAAPLGDGAFAEMAWLARRHGLYLLGTTLERNPKGKPFNTAALYGPDGKLLASYRKVHLFPPMGEVEHMAPGEALPVFDLPWGRTALAICYDLRFPELWRCYMEAGARLVLSPSEWPVRRIEHWRLLLRARAVENQYFVAGCNRAGSAADGEFGGHSAAVDPWGRVLVEGEAEPGLFFATLDLDEVDRCRQTFAWLEDRQPEVYHARP